MSIFVAVCIGVAWVCVGINLWLMTERNKEYRKELREMRERHRKERLEFEEWRSEVRALLAARNKGRPS